MEFEDDKHATFILAFKKRKTLLLKTFANFSTYSWGGKDFAAKLQWQQFKDALLQCFSNLASLRCVIQLQGKLQV